VVEGEILSAGDSKVRNVIVCITPRPAERAEIPARGDRVGRVALLGSRHADEVILEAPRHLHPGAGLCIVPIFCAVRPSRAELPLLPPNLDDGAVVVELWGDIGELKCASLLQIRHLHAHRHPALAVGCLKVSDVDRCDGVSAGGGGRLVIGERWCWDADSADGERRKQRELH